MTTSKTHSVLSVKDFGAIAEATVELRPLTVFVGPSNTGKSYLAILIYALHKFFGDGQSGRWWMKRPFYRSPLRGLSSKASRKALEAALPWAEREYEAMRTAGAKSEVSVEFPEELAKLVRSILRDVSESGPLFDAEITRCFGVQKASSLIRSRSKAAKITLRRDHVGDMMHDQPLAYEFTVERNGSQLAATIHDDIALRFEGVHRRPYERLLNMLTRSQVDESFYRNRLIAEVADLVLPYLVGPISRPIHYLPADRAGIMHAHRVVVSSLLGRASRAGLKAESPLPTLSGVLTDFLDHIVGLGESRLREGPNTKLAQRLEAEILHGAVQIQSSVVGYPSFNYRPSAWKRGMLPLMTTSSMVSELTPVVLYLRYFARKGDILIIEEPESHLHPAMQVSFTRLLAAMVKSGMRVIITTHSEWVLETLANLVRLSDVKKSNRKRILDEDLALTSNQVGAWLFSPKQRPRGSVVKEIPLDMGSGTFPAEFGEITEGIYNEWASIANFVEEEKR